MQRHHSSLDRGTTDLTGFAQSSASSLPNSTSNGFEQYNNSVPQKKLSNNILSDDDVSDDTVSSSDGSFKPPVLSDYSKALLSDPASSKAKARLPTSSSASTIQESTNTPNISSASNSSLRIGSVFSSGQPLMHQYKSPRATARASPINGTRQQHEIQRHLNRVKLEQKSASEEDLNDPISGRLRHHSSHSSNGSNQSLGERKVSSSSLDLSLPKPAAGLEAKSVPDSPRMGSEPADANVEISNDQAYSPIIGEEVINKSPIMDYLPSPSESGEFIARSPPLGSSLIDHKRQDTAFGFSTPGVTRSTNPRANPSTIRVKRFGRGLGPPKRAVPRESEEGLSSANENGDHSEDLDKPRKTRFAPTPMQDANYSVDSPMLDADFSSPLVDNLDYEPPTLQKSDQYSSPLGRSNSNPSQLAESLADSDRFKQTEEEVPKMDRLDASESDAARKRRSELYDAAERAHSVSAMEDKEENLHKEAQEVLERQHEELKHHLQIQEQLIQQQQKQLQQAQLQQAQSLHGDDPMQMQHQQFMIMQQQQQQQQQLPKPSIIQPQPASRKQKNMIYVNNQPYQRLELIGRGGSSKVYKAQASSGKVYAIKRVSCDDDIDYSVLKGFKGEIDLLQRLKNEDRVVKLIDYEMRPSSIYVVMECGEIDLAHVLNARLSQPLDISFVRYYSVEMLHCVAAVHRHDIVHSDLKPANFLLVKGMLKIIDFGIANVVPDYTSNVHRDTQIGTPNYMAPEALLDANHINAATSKTPEKSNDSNDTSNDRIMNNNRNSIISLNNSNIYAPIPPPVKPTTTKFKVGRPSDVWSCGCIIYQMIYGRPPYGGFQGTQRMLAIMNPKVQINYPKQGLGQVRVPKEAIEAIKGCLDRDPTQRMTIDQAMNGSFLNPQAVDRKFIQDLLSHAVKYGAERGMAVNGKELDLLTDTVWKKIQATNL